MRDLSNAIFEDVAGDVEALKEWHANSNAPRALDPEQLAAKGPNYWHRRIRRLVREAEELKRALRAVLDKYMDCVDPLSGKQLFADKELVEQLHTQVIKLIDIGSFCGKCFPLWLGWD